MIVGGVAVIGMGIAVAMALNTQLDELKGIVEANSRLTDSEKAMVVDWLRSGPLCTIAIVGAGLIAALPYFALAQLLKGPSPRH